MSYYLFNRKKILKNARDNYHNKSGKKAANYYIANKEVLKEDARNNYRNMSKKEKEKKRKYQRDRYHMNTDLNERQKNIKEIIVLQRK